MFFFGFFLLRSDSRLGVKDRKSQSLYGNDNAKKDEKNKIKQIDFSISV
jgi:hypothetical protein